MTTVFFFFFFFFFAFWPYYAVCGILVPCCCYVTSVVSDSVRPHRRQPTRLLCPWDSPGKNTGVGCHYPSPMHESEKWKGSRSVTSDSSQPHGLQPTRLLRPWDFPGKSTGVGCHCLLWTNATLFILLEMSLPLPKCICKRLCLCMSSVPQQILFH